MARVCSKHGVPQYVPDGTDCPWCEPTPVFAAMCRLWRQLAEQDKADQPPPKAWTRPVANAQQAAVQRAASQPCDCGRAPHFEAYEDCPRSRQTWFAQQAGRQ